MSMLEQENTPSRQLADEVDPAASADHTSEGLQRQGSDGQRRNETESHDMRSEPDDDAASTKEPPNLLTRLSGYAKMIFGIILNLLLIFVLVGCLAVIVKEFATRAIVLDVIEVPEAFSKQIATSNSISRRLADRFAEIQERSSEGPLSRHRLLEPAWLQADIQVPGASLSIQSIVGFFKQEFGRADIHIGGEISSNGHEKYRLTLRNVQSGETYLSDEFSSDKLDGIIPDAALGLTKIADPYLLASYYFNIEQKTNSFPLTKHWARYALNSDYDRAAARAYNILGNVASYQGAFDDAVRYYIQAIDSPNSFAEVHSNLGDTYAAQGKIDQAREEYLSAMRLDPSLTSAILGLSDLNLNAGQYDEAARLARYAIAAHRNEPRPHVSLAWILSV